MSKNIKLIVAVNPNEQKVQLSPTLMMWVLENLIKNSIDATRGKGSIKLTLRWDKNAIISIQDTGAGIPKNRQNKIFIPGETTKKRGWGLGLSLAKRIVEQHHQGKLKLVASTASGTTFQIELPIKQMQH
jgi:signal transduction histidine kinase